MRVVDESNFESPEEILAPAEALALVDDGAEETPPFNPAVSPASTGENPNVVSTYDEAFEKKIKERVENVDVSAHEEPPKKSHKKLWIALISVFILLLGGSGVAVYLNAFGVKDLLFGKPVEETPELEIAEEVEEEPAEEKPKFYSRLSGEEIASAEEDSAPTFCVQIPNGVDGARDQVGLSHAKIVFEAIAEAGITRFAAIFQNPPAVVGPIRSLRMYYFNWDGPFDCTIVHAGGEDGAVEALRASGNRDLDESFTYMWRSDAFYPSGQTTSRLWNNLFSGKEELNAFNLSKGYLSSDIKSFPRLLPEEAYHNLVDAQASNRLRIDSASSSDTNVLSAKVNHIVLKFGYVPNFNPVFDYNPATNSYNRSYETGAAHNVFDYDGETCSSVQLSPSIVIAMIVQERKAWDNYHEDISSLGAGDAYIFQNGDVIVGTWEKSARMEQIIFRDAEGKEVSLIPGQTWISAIPNYGSVHYE
ncbi:DUF3048 domain-containing protein [Candidatus Saccharibacteria bacterium]|nr:DUF3048 domain-containing protein [Candidatus Saccharibacteria bacterium]